MNQLYTCPGEQQTVICNANYKFLKWSVTTIDQMLHESGSVPYMDQHPDISPIMTNFANFTFSRESSPGALPLVSTMTINIVTSNLEGSIVNCTGTNSSSLSSVVLTKIIHVFDVNIGRSDIEF